MIRYYSLGHSLFSIILFSLLFIAIRYSLLIIIHDSSSFVIWFIIIRFSLEYSSFHWYALGYSPFAIPNNYSFVVIHWNIRSSLFRIIIHSLLFIIRYYSLEYPLFVIRYYAFGYRLFGHVCHSLVFVIRHYSLFFVTLVIRYYSSFTITHYSLFFIVPSFIICYYSLLFVLR